MTRRERNSSGRDVRDVCDQSQNAFMVLLLLLPVLVVDVVVVSLHGLCGELLTLWFLFGQPMHIKESSLVYHYRP